MSTRKSRELKVQIRSPPPNQVTKSPSSHRSPRRTSSMFIGGFRDSFQDIMDIASVQSSDRKTFYIRFLHGVLSTTWATVISIVFLLVPISMIIVGSIYVNACPANVMIPVYLLVAGTVSIILRMFNIGQRCCLTVHERMDRERVMGPIEVIALSFLVAWFGAGCYFVYGTIGRYQSDDRKKPLYCNRVLFSFAFWLMTGHFIFAALYIIATLMAGFILYLKLK